MTLPAFVVLHTGQGVRLGAYLFRVLVSLLAIVGTGVATYWCIQAIATIRSGNGRRGETDENEP